MKFSDKTGKSELSMLTNIFVFDNINTFIGQLAQLVEPLVYTQVVGSSSLSLPSKIGFFGSRFFLPQNKNSNKMNHAARISASLQHASKKNAALFIKAQHFFQFSES